MKTETSLLSTVLKSVSEVIVVTLVCLFFIRGVFLNQGQIGHNWDFTFPSFVSSANNINFLSAYTWNSSNLGYQQHLTAAHLIPNYLYSLLISGFGTEQGSKLLLLTILVVAVFGFAKFSTLIHLKISRPISLLLGLTYTFCPFLFNEIVGGSWYMWFSYAFIPWYLYSVISFFSTKNSFLVSTLLFSNLMVSSLQNFVIVHGITMLYLFASQTHLSSFLKKIFLLHLFLFVTNFYWIGLTLSILFSLANQFSSGGFTNQFDQVKNSSQSLSSIFSLYGYLDRDFYKQAIPKISLLFYQLAVCIVWLSGIYMFYIKNKKINNKVLWLLLLLCFSFLIVKGGGTPFSFLTIFIFENVPLMSLYRSPQHLMLIPTLVFFVLLVLLTKYSDNKKNTKWSFGVLILFLLILSSGWWINGDLGHKKMISQGRDFVDFYKLDLDLVESLKISETSSQVFRHLFIPVTHSPLYQQTSYQNPAQGGISEYMYLKTPTFSAESSVAGKEIEDAICIENMQAFDVSLSKYSVGLVTIRNDISPIFTDCSRSWNSNSVAIFISKSKMLEPLIVGPNTTTYRVNDVTKIVSSDQESAVKVLKINPTKYQIETIGPNPVNRITLNENYSKFWQIVDIKGKTIARSNNLNGINYFNDLELKPSEKYYIYFSMQKYFIFFITISILGLIASIYLFQKNNEK